MVVHLSPMSTSPQVLSGHRKAVQCADRVFVAYDLEDVDEAARLLVAGVVLQLRLVEGDVLHLLEAVASRSGDALHALRIAAPGLDARLDVMAGVVVGCRVLRAGRGVLGEAALKALRGVDELRAELRETAYAEGVNVLWPHDVAVAQARSGEVPTVVPAAPRLPREELPTIRDAPDTPSVGPAAAVPPPVAPTAQPPASPVTPPRRLRVAPPPLPPAATAVPATSGGPVVPAAVAANPTPWLLAAFIGAFAYGAGLAHGTTLSAVRGAAMLAATAPPPPAPTRPAAKPESDPAAAPEPAPAPAPEPEPEPDAAPCANVPAVDATTLANAFQLRDRGRLEAAHGQLCALARRLPTSFDIQLELARVLTARRRPAQALIAAARAGTLARRASQRTQAALAAVDARAVGADRPRARRDLERLLAVTMAPQRRQVVVRLVADGRRALRDGALIRADRLFHRAHLLDERRVAALLGIGEAQLRLRRAEAAAHAAKRALAVDARSPSGHLILGDALDKLGRREAARRHWERAVSLAPRSREARARLKG